MSSATRNPETRSRNRLRLLTKNSCPPNSLHPNPLANRGSHPPDEGVRFRQSKTDNQTCGRIVFSGRPGYPSWKSRSYRSSLTTESSSSNDGNRCPGRSRFVRIHPDKPDIVRWLRPSQAAQHQQLTRSLEILRKNRIFHTPSQQVAIWEIVCPPALPRRPHATASFRKIRARATPSRTAWHRGKPRRR